MPFITQPKVEGQKMDCPNCGQEVISRLKEYKDFPSKIQWQDKEQTKAHFDKNGACKGQQDTSETTQSTMQSEQSLSKGESNPEIISLATLDDKIKTLHGMCEAILHIVSDMKTQGVKCMTGADEFKKIMEKHNEL